MPTLNELKEKCIEDQPQLEEMIEADFADLKLSAKLRELRKKAGLTQKEVAERLGVRRSYISQLETDPRNLTIKTLIRFGRAVGARFDINGELQIDNEIAFEAEIFAECPVKPWNDSQLQAILANINPESKQHSRDACFKWLKRRVGSSVGITKECDHQWISEIKKANGLSKEAAVFYSELRKFDAGQSGVVVSELKKKALSEIYDNYQLKFNTVRGKCELFVISKARGGEILDSSSIQILLRFEKYKLNALAAISWSDPRLPDILSAFGWEMDRANSIEIFQEEIREFLVSFGGKDWWKVLEKGGISAPVSAVLYDLYRFMVDIEEMDAGEEKEYLRTTLIRSFSAFDLELSQLEGRESILRLVPGKASATANLMRCERAHDNGHLKMVSYLENEATRHS
jgi:transcriptional regulator with XRE-family HTH domain